MSPYLRLSRLHRPVGIFLLLLPCWWGVALAAPRALNLKLLVLFALGAAAMRGAGCTFNDLMDRKIDAQVARTKMRPLAKGEVSPAQALLFFGLQCLAGLAVLGNLPSRCWPLSLAALILLIIYPFMKRITHWPQLVLGFAFNLGVIFGAVAATPYETLNWFAVLSLYGAGIAWTLGYDTIYALQDIEDDLKIGVKSTAIRFGKDVKSALAASYSVMFALLIATGYGAKANPLYYSLIALSALATIVALLRLNPACPADCLKVFNVNPSLGFLVWLALLAL